MTRVPEIIIPKERLGLISWRGKEFFSQSQLSVQALLQYLYSPCVLHNALTYVHMLKKTMMAIRTFV